MDYYGLKSIVSSQKKPFELKTESDSFFLKSKRSDPYIEPMFKKEEFPTEKPAILLVGALGASGKTTSAHALAFDTKLPIFDLAKHKPVADNTLTGVLTSAYQTEQVGQILEGLSKGNHGVIIDGLDEGRSKTTELGFEAFLDDLIVRSKGAKSTAIVIFGRSQVLINTWVYLIDNNADVGLIHLQPFDLNRAKLYIDAYVGNRKASQNSMYEKARDNLLKNLGKAFESSENNTDAFLMFIGYPPVLDAIAILLKTITNYHNINQQLSGSSSRNLEIDLLIRISRYLLQRERQEKALPNFINNFSKQADEVLAAKLRKSLFNPEEQCARLLSYALNIPFPKRIIEDLALNQQYEKALETWLLEHPFLRDNHVRNPIFESFAVAQCALSEIEEYKSLAHQYTSSKQSTYHLLYMMDELTGVVEIEARFFNMLIQSCADLLGMAEEIEVEVEGISWEEFEIPPTTSVELSIKVKWPVPDKLQVFGFSGNVKKANTLTLGPNLFNTKLTLPCEVRLYGVPAFEVFGDCTISANRVHFDTPDLIIRSEPKTSLTPSLYLDVRNATGHVDMVSSKGSTIEISCIDHSLTYPLAKYATKTKRSLIISDFSEKYQRLRRILLEFRSHSKGNLAKFRDKIEHERILKGEIGKSVLNKLLSEEILTCNDKFYFVDQENFSNKLSTSWTSLKNYDISNEIKEFLDTLE